MNLLHWLMTPVRTVQRWRMADKALWLERGGTYGYRRDSPAPNLYYRDADAAWRQWLKLWEGR